MSPRFVRLLDSRMTLYILGCARVWVRGVCLLGGDCRSREEQEVTRSVNVRCRLPSVDHVMCACGAAPLAQKNTVHRMKAPPVTHSSLHARPSGAESSVTEINKWDVT